MRIIAGEKRGMRLLSLPGQDTRPTLDRVKEGMFSAIQFLLPGAQVLDLFAGSGQLGLEALSRGAAACTFVDSSPAAIKVIRANCGAAGFGQSGRVVRSDVAAFVAHNREKYDIILIDPPFNTGVLPGLLQAVASLAAPRAVILCESETGVDFPPQVDALALRKQYRYGTVLVSRYENL